MPASASAFTRRRFSHAAFGRCSDVSVRGSRPGCRAAAANHRALAGRRWRRHVRARHPGATQRTARPDHPDRQYRRRLGPGRHADSFSRPAGRPYGASGQRHVRRNRGIADPGTASVRSAFTPVTLAASAPQGVFTHPRSGLKTLADYVAAAKARPGALNVGIPGIASSQHLTSELLLRAAGNATVAHVPYRGGGPLIQDLIAGNIDAGVVTFAAAAQQAAAGQLIALGVHDSRSTGRLFRGADGRRDRCTWFRTNNMDGCAGAQEHAGQPRVPACIRPCTGGAEGIPP